MELRVKDMDIATGDVAVVILNEKDAQDLDLHHMDRLVVRLKKKSVIAILDIAETKKAVPKGHIGLFEETLDALNAKHHDHVTIDIADKPESVTFIRKKLAGKHLNSSELRTIVEDIVDNKLTDIELTSFVTATYAHGMSAKEIKDMTVAMAETGQILKFNHGAVVDLHSLGGVPGNRTTMLIVPIMIAAGCTMPKTSSRAITSPSGTADTMEVLCSVDFTVPQLKKLVKKVGGFLIWGGCVNLAPADDRIIRIEHPLSIDAEGQMIASIMAKKASVSPTHLLLEIPYGPGTKVRDVKHGKHLRKHFAQLGNALGIKVKTMIINGSEPVGNGIGPVLEARDVLWALKCSTCQPQDLVKKSIKMAGELLEFVGKAPKGKGKKMATEIMDSGKAYDTFVKMVKAQGGKVPDPNKLKPAKLTYTLRANKNGTVSCILNQSIAKIARLAGAPVDKDAGLYLHKHCCNKVKKGEAIMTVYARSKHKLAHVKKAIKKLGAVVIS